MHVEHDASFYAQQNVSYTSNFIATLFPHFQFLILIKKPIAQDITHI